MKKIAVIDDQVEITDLLKTILENEGYQVKVYNESKNVIEKLREYLPSLIMLDIHMPEVNGIEVLKKIKEDKIIKNIPVIMLTVDGSPEEINTSISYGANSYILKPAKKEEILRVVKSILGDI